MVELLKNLARRIFLSDTAQDVNEIVVRYSQRGQLRHWEETGRAIPPPHSVKQAAVKEYAARFSLDTLIETGTYLGAMVGATKDTFKHIYSIELDRALYRRARKKYARYSHISLFHGDSGQILPQILAGITHPCLFWLDAHHSGVLTARGDLASPVMLEISHILNHPVADHVILIDDAHAFVGQDGYPPIAGLQNVIAARRPGWALRVKDDIIRIHKG